MGIFLIIQVLFFATLIVYCTMYRTRSESKIVRAGVLWTVLVEMLLLGVALIVTGY